MSTTVTRRLNPFPGLRPFEENEDDLFFGRDAQVDDLIGRLRRRRLIAVIGTSGSGKSSLVRAGLLPALHGGFMAGVGSRWRVATMRPGSSPIANLADALDAAGLAGPPDVERETRIGLTHAGLDRGSRGLIDVLRESDRAQNENVLLLVDQFEELFRYQQEHPNEAAAFVKLLLTASESKDVPIYVMLTMRSDFLGDCAQFDELAQRINDGLFLVPRMTWDQLREAIEMPVLAAGAEIDPALTTRLLNDLGDSPDRLPVLQHALMRTWNLHEDTGDHIVLTLEDFARTGGLENALSLHGDEVLATLDESDRLAAEKLFKCITELAGDNRGIRRPTRLGDICAITGTSFEQMSRVVEAFRAPSCAFLAVRRGPLTENSVIDIAHEGLMRIWRLLVAWVDEEAQSAQQYHRLATAATLHAENRAALWRNPDLQIAENWRTKDAPNAAWAKHVDPHLDFAQTMTFLDESIKERARERARRLRTSRLVFGGLTVLVLIMSAVAALALQQAHIAAEERRHVLVAESRFLSRDAAAAIDRGDAVTGMLLAIQAENVGGADRPLEAEYTLENALANQHEQRDFLGHTDAIEGVAFSPDGRHLVSGGDQTTRIWDIASGKQLALFHGHTGGLSWAVYSPDGKYVLTSSIDKTARIWNAATGAPGPVMRAPAGVESAVFSPDGRLVAGAIDDKTIRIWDAKSGRQTAVLRGHTGQVLYAGFSHDGKRLVSASSDKSIRIWDVASWTQLTVLHGNTSAVNSVAYSPDDHRIASAAVDGTVRIWDPVSHTQLAALSGHTQSASCVAFSPDGRKLVSSSFDGTMRIWDAVNYRLIAVLSGHYGPVDVVAFSPDGKQIVTGSDDRTVRLWNIASGVPSLVIRGTAPQFDVSFSPDGKRVVSGSNSHDIYVWNTVTGAQVAVLRGHPKGAWSAVFSPDGRRIVSGSGDKTVRIWNATNDKVIAILRGHTEGVHRATYSPDGRHIASASIDHTVRVWNATSGAQTAVLRGHSDEVWDAEFSPDGKRIVSASSDSTARLWNASGGPPIKVFRGHEGQVFSAKFSPDGKTIATASLDRTVRIWDVATGNQLAVLYGHQAPVIDVAFSRDGRRLVSSSMDRTVRIWDVASGAQVAILEGHEAYVYGVQFSPGGQRIASASEDGTVRIWDVRPRLRGQALIDAAEAAVPRQLTAYQRNQEFLDSTQP